MEKQYSEETIRKLEDHQYRLKIIRTKLKHATEEVKKLLAEKEKQENETV